MIPPDRNVYAQQALWFVRCHAFLVCAISNPFGVFFASWAAMWTRCGLVFAIVAAMLTRGSSAPVDDWAARVLLDLGSPALLSALGVQTLAEVQHYINGVPRSLDFLELFAGCQRLTASMSRIGLRSTAMDIKIDPALHDLASPIGQAHAVWQALRLRPFGLCSASPVCSTMVWMARSHSKRNKEHPEGDESRQDVVDANNMSQFVSVLMAMLFMRKVFWVVEQPHTSVMWLLPEWPLLADTIQLEKVFLWLGSYGHGCLKPSVFWTTLDTFASLKRPKPIEATSQEQPLWVKKNNWVTGTAALKTSENFPIEFCECFAQAYAETDPFVVIKQMLCLCRHSSNIFNVLRLVMYFMAGMTLETEADGRFKGLAAPRPSRSRPSTPLARRVRRKSSSTLSMRTTSPQFSTGNSSGSMLPPADVMSASGASSSWVADPVVSPQTTQTTLFAYWAKMSNPDKGRTDKYYVPAAQPQPASPDNNSEPETSERTSPHKPETSALTAAWPAGTLKMHSVKVPSEHESSDTESDAEWQW
jgi:hypothetical protein